MGIYLIASSFPTPGQVVVISSDTVNSIHMVVLAVEGIALTLVVVWYIWVMAQKVSKVVAGISTACVLNLSIFLCGSPTLCSNARMVRFRNSHFPSYQN